MEQNVKEITPAEVLEKIKHSEKVQIIDVREVEEWNAGHIKEARLIPLGILPYELDSLDRNTPIIMVCRSGARSHSATDFLTQHGFNASNMVGGMLAWPGEVER